MSMSPTISDRSVVVAAKDHVSCDLAGEAAILNIKNGVYYGLDPIGARIWNLMQEPRAVAEIQNTITNEYDVAPERCARDANDSASAGGTRIAAPIVAVLAARRGDPPGPRRGPPDLVGLLEKLLAEGLIEVKDGSAA